MKVKVFINYRDQYDVYTVHKDHYCILDTGDENDRAILDAIYDGREGEALDLIGWNERDMRITRIAA